MLGYSESGDDTDRALTALCHPLRRRLLFRLFESNSPAVVDLGDEFGEDELHAARLKLYHVHLPKLADLGYVQWKQDDGTVAPGDDWEAVEPLLALIYRHVNELPPSLRGEKHSV